MQLQALQFSSMKNSGDQITALKKHFIYLKEKYQNKNNERAHMLV